MDRDCVAYGKPGDAVFVHRDKDGKALGACENLRQDREYSWHPCRQICSNPEFDVTTESQDSNIPEEIIIQCADTKSKKICGSCRSRGLVCKSCYDNFNLKYKDYNLALNDLALNDLAVMK